jgi:uncharacterized repeat protein (TIGR01451 family)
MPLRIILSVIIVCLILGILPTLAQSQRTPAGLVISNRATGRYLDAKGTSYSTVSETVTITVRAVSAVTVTPDETEASATIASNDRITRVFRVCNPGNTLDRYTISNVSVSAPSSINSLYYDVDSSGTVTSGDTLITVGTTQSPQIAAAACINILAVVNTGAVTNSSRLRINLTARSTMSSSNNSVVEDTGTIINAVGRSPQLTDPTNPTLQPLKLVDGQAKVGTSVGQTVSYAISFRNHGDVTARNVVLADDLPVGLSYVSSSLRLGQTLLTDADDSDQGQASERRIVLRFNAVAPGELVQISFQALVTSRVIRGVGAVNVAAISGENIPSIATTAATAVVDPFGTVFAARSGGSVVINGAQVKIINQNGTTLSIPPNVGFPPNLSNDNPYTTVTNGRFSFALTPEQLGTITTPATYTLSVEAANYRSRMLSLSLSPTSTGLYQATVRSLDGEPLAVADGFQLTNNPIHLSDIAVVALNVPMFETSLLQINKVADKQNVEVGSAVQYRIDVSNRSVVPLNEVVIRDVLPESFHYAKGTALIFQSNSDQRTIEPEINGRDLIFRLGTLSAGTQVSLSYRVRIGVNVHEGEYVNQATGTGIFPSGERITTPVTRAIVRVRTGMFSSRQVLIGRVFEDVNGNTLFDKGDKPVAGVRLYLDKGQSVITDSEGLYNFPSIEDGAVVIAIDPISLPSGYMLTDDRISAGRSWTRLLRTPLGGGGLLRQNFALQRDPRAVLNNKDNNKIPSNLPSKAETKLETREIYRTEKGEIIPVDPIKLSGNINIASLKPGTYETVSTEAITPIAPGDMRVLYPATNEVILEPALQIDISVAFDWSLVLKVNGRSIGEANNSIRRLDRRNKIATYSFAGINLHPGPNVINITPIGPNRETGVTKELLVYGRGQAKRLDIEADRTELKKDGRDATTIKIRAWDEWNHPATDGSVAIQVSSGKLILSSDALRKIPELIGSGLETSRGLASEQVNATVREGILKLNNGEAKVQLIADYAAESAEIIASIGNIEKREIVKFIPELRPTFLLSLAEFSFGRAAPEMALRQEDKNFRSHIEFFYRGQIGNKNLLTMAYDSQRPINRTEGSDRLFQLDPLDRVYPIFGDSSTRFENAASNSKFYGRIDRGRSHVMFGDFDANMKGTMLASYSRKHTGVKVHAENSDGDFITVTGARPDTAFARDLFPGSLLGFIRLSHTDLLVGSETVVLETRDRRNPEHILSREFLVRSVDYNTDLSNGIIYFLRPVSALNQVLNVVQIVVTYEYHTRGISSLIYTARTQKELKPLGLRLGLSFVNQQQSDYGTFVLGGIDVEKKLPYKGRLSLEWVMSRGRIAGNGNLFNFNDTNDRYDGHAYRAELEQPIKFKEGILRASFMQTQERFLNPFGSTTVPGVRRGNIDLDLKIRPSSIIRLGFTDERNKTVNVSNSRATFSLGWTENINEHLSLNFGYDHRRLDDQKNSREITSNLLTASADWRPVNKLQLMVKREQNLTTADPTYPNQTVLAANYHVKDWAKIFFTQRLASAPIVPLADVTTTGFASLSSRNETSIGIESKLGRYTSLSNSYRIENGINGTDSFAVIGLQNSLPINKQFSLDLGFEHGAHITGQGGSFTAGQIGASWHPNDRFRSSGRYELRSRNGFGHALTFGAAGAISRDITTLAQMQWTNSNVLGTKGDSLNATAAMALRPLRSDRVGLLFSYTHQDYNQNGSLNQYSLMNRANTISSDGFVQATKRLELYGRFALRFEANSQQSLPYTSTLTYMTQGRAQYKIGRYFDVATEGRWFAQPVSQTRRTSLGTEIGFWVMPDLRLAGGYNFTSSIEPRGILLPNGGRRGFYFVISSKLSNLFNLFGTSSHGLADQDSSSGSNNPSSNK